MVDVSVVVPTKNEQISVAEFIRWCKEGFASANVTGEIILMDSSSDETERIAKSMGAKVIPVSEPGLGVAYASAKPHINGEIVILGDADCTYDFRALGPFISKIRSGADLVMGSRFKGEIAKGAMPVHHQYFGSPSTTFLFRTLLGIPVSDIHCGMRALRKEHYLALPFLEPGWLYATEMIVASRNLGGRIEEVPIRFLQEPEGRESHHVRSGWTSPFKAGWGTLRIVVTYALDRILIIPSAIMALLFFVLAALRISFPGIFEYWGIGIAGGAMFSALSIAGIFSFSVGVIASTLHDQTGATRARWKRILPASRLFTLGAWSATLLVIITATFIILWAGSLSTGGSNNFQLTGLWLVITNVCVGVCGLSFTALIIDYLDKTAKHAPN